MKIPKEGSKWEGTRNDKFRVLQTIELDGNLWIHYIKEDSNEPKEYSCYLESFLARFKELSE